MTQRIVHPRGGVKLYEDEFVGMIAYFSGTPIEKIWELWRNGSTFGSLATGEASIKDVVEK